MPTTRRVKLTPAFQRYFVPNATDGYRMTVTASDAVGMPNAVFAYMAHPLGQGETEPRAEFSHVCSPVDLEEFPEDDPLPDASPAWFRLASIDCVFRSRTLALEYWDVVQAEVSSLKNSLDVMDELEPGPEVWIGDPPP